MTQQMRYDRASFKARITKDGYLEDTPVIARVGIQEYKRADGSVRRELRLPEHVFHPDSLESFIGKPITDDHPPEPVTARNFKKYAIGAITSKGIPDGNDLRVSLTVHDGQTVDKATKGGKFELSVGYTVVLDETPGEWEGQKYDAVQTHIDVNHLSIVQRGRAGNARLNLDSGDAVSINLDKEITMSETLSRLRLDGGLEYQAAPEVVHAYEKLRKDVTDITNTVADVTKRLDSVTAERDTLKAQVESADKMRSDALVAARKEIKERLDLEKVAADFKVDCTDKSDREVKELVIKTLRSDADLTGKSEDYISAAFDLTVASKKDTAVEAQRSAGARKDSESSTARASYQVFMKSLSKGAI